MQLVTNNRRHGTRFRFHSKWHLYSFFDVRAEGEREVVPVLNQVPRSEDVLGSGDIAPRILNLGSRWMSFQWINVLFNVIL
jgi:hypothetical protein